MHFSFYNLPHSMVSIIISRVESAPLMRTANRCLASTNIPLRMQWYDAVASCCKAREQSYNGLYPRVIPRQPATQVSITNHASLEECFACILSNLARISANPATALPGFILPNVPVPEANLVVPCSWLVPCGWVRRLPAVVLVPDVVLLA